MTERQDAKSRKAPRKSSSATLARKKSESAAQNLGMMSVEKERRKMESEMKKKHDIESKRLAKEQRRIDSQNKALTNKMQKFQKDKTETEALRRQLTQEKELWLNRKRKKPVDAKEMLKEIDEKIQHQVKRMEEADAEWAKIKEERIQLNEQVSNCERDRRSINSDRSTLNNNIAVYDKDRAELDERIAINKTETERLAKFDEKIQEREVAVAARGKEYDMLDMRMKDRELDVEKRDAQLKKERSQIEDLKKNLFKSLNVHRRAFSDRYRAIGTTIQKWNATFESLFTDSLAEGGSKADVVENPNSGAKGGGTETDSGAKEEAGAASATVDAIEEDTAASPDHTNEVTEEEH